MTYNPQRALELLRIGSGRADATFREGQEDAIRHIVDGRGRGREREAGKLGEPFQRSRIGTHQKR